MAEAKPVLILRADAGGSLGSGHVMRVLALGEAWAAAGGVFILASASIPDPVAARAEAMGAGLFSVDAEAWSAGDAEAVSALAKRTKAVALVADSYFFTTDYLATLTGAGHVVAAIDDVARLQLYPCAIVINPNLHGRLDLYAGKADDALKLMGPDYVMLRQEFMMSRGKRAITPVARKLLATFGGVDPKGASLVFVEAMRLLGGKVSATLVIGAVNPNGDEIAIRARSALGLKVARAAKDMARRMAAAEMVVSAGGTTVWEAAAVTAPMMLVASAPEEEIAAERLARAGGCRYLGPVENLEPAGMAAAIADFAGDLAARARSSVIGGELIDGKGSQRVVDAIVSVALGQAPEA